MIIGVENTTGLLNTSLTNSNRMKIFICIDYLFACEPSWCAVKHASSFERKDTKTINIETLQAEHREHWFIR
ncbi:hypothetical protein RRG08_015771 [Elysia crispata]|uniref:Uncharacterized protein n=1 Tax=Elysia crispata TaxID=231223 RepID=A0AAE1D0Y4_9GAST|nr:hypothetical protein RRG08_015771 [Elysia crispata]